MVSLPPLYILDSEEQRRVIDTLSSVEWDAAGWTGRYMDDAGEEWMLYYPFSAYHGGGPPYLRRGHPPTDNEDVPAWVVALLRSGREDDAEGASTDLMNRPETWSAVLDRIEAEQASLDPVAIAVFIDGLGVVDPMNRRPVLHKAMAEIVSDAAHFRALSQRAVRLLGAG